MKRQIDLRPREFVVAREFYFPRVLLIVAVILLVTAVAGGFGYLYVEKVETERELSRLTAEREEMQEQLEPLEEMERTLEEIEQRESLREEFEERRIAWSRYLTRILDVSGGETQVNQVSASREGGGVSLSGRSDSMEEVALFVQDLEDMEFLEGASYESIVKEGEEEYSFSIVAVLENWAEEQEEDG